MNQLEESLASAIYEAAVGTIDNKVVTMSTKRTPRHKRGTPQWWTKELREREARIRSTKKAYYSTAHDAATQYTIGTHLHALEEELAAEVGRTNKRRKRETSMQIERLLGEDEQAGHRKHAWDIIQSPRKRSRSGAGRAAPLVRNKDGIASRDARESSQNWITSWSEVGSYNPEDSAYDKQHRADIEIELERISALEEQRAQRQLSSSEWMKDAEDVVVCELDAAEFEEIHGIDVEDIHAEERDAYTDLNAMWSEDELGPALSQMKHYKAAGEDGIVAEFMKLGGEEVRACILLLLNAVWRLECCPVRWTRAVAWPIYKAGARDDPSNYRLITLLSAVCKVYERMINNRITTLIRISLKFNRPLITYTQVGFQFARSTLDAVYALTLAVSVRRLCGMPTYLAFIDVKKAFPSAFKAGILVKLYRMGITGKCLRMLRNMYSTVR